MTPEELKRALECRLPKAGAMTAEEAVANLIELASLDCEQFIKKIPEFNESRARVLSMMRREEHDAVDDIRMEREKQRAKWGDEHDDMHQQGEILLAATNLLLSVRGGKFPDPWGLIKKNPHPNDRMRIAGALIAAELDRRDRAIVAHEKAHDPAATAASSIGQCPKPTQCVAMSSSTKDGWESECRSCGWKFVNGVDVSRQDTAASALADVQASRGTPTIATDGCAFNVIGLDGDEHQVVDSHAWNALRDRVAKLEGK